MNKSSSDKLITLIYLQRQALEAENLEKLSHIITNETYKLVPYKQAIFFRTNGKNIKLHSASGNTQLDPLSPYAITLESYIYTQCEKATLDAFNAENKDTDTSAALILFKTSHTGLIGGLWLETEEPLNKAQLQILSELSVPYAHALAHQKTRNFNAVQIIKNSMSKYRLYIGLAMLITFCFPIRESITAPAEIVAKDPFIISAPYDGIIESVEVSPGDSIKSGDPLVHMDKITLQAQMDAAEKEANASSARLSRLRREALSDPDKKIELKQIENELSLKKIELDYANDMLERSLIKSPIDGIAIFSDKNVLEGKPAQTGQNIMTIADPEKQELLIRIPSGSMILFDTKNSAKFYPNVSPFFAHKAAIKTIGYQASPDSNGLLSYKIRANLAASNKPMRIGWKGTAKIYGSYTIFGYTLLRKPLLFIREITGL